jgi:anti-anti-sigma factor
MSSADVVKMPKRFDYSSSSEFNSAFGAALSAGANVEKTILLDCLQLDYIDSAGIGLLVMAHKKAQASSVKITIINIKPSAKEILMLANLQKLMEIK